MTESTSRLELKVLPPFVAAIAAILIWLIATFIPFGQFDFSRREMLSLALIVLALAIVFSGIMAFHRAGTTIEPNIPYKATTLVTHGIYRLTRNPMYLGLSILLTAFAFYTGKFLSFLMPLLFMIYLTRYQIIPEERALTSLFGEEFERYRKRVRRWM